MQDAYGQLLVERDGPVLTITLSRPERLNAFTKQMGAELLAAFDRADADDARSPRWTRERHGTSYVSYNI